MVCRVPAMVGQPKEATLIADRWYLSQARGIIRKPQPKPTLKVQIDEIHAGEPQKFKMEVVKMHGGNALLRQISEAVQIHETIGLMNRQEEWRQIQLPHLGLS